MTARTSVRAARALAAPIAVAGAAAALVLPAVIPGSAARLEVRAAAPLQVIVVDDVQFQAPPPAPVFHTITVIARRFNSGNGKEVGGSPTTTATLVPDGQRYQVSWSGSQIVPCSSVEHTVGTGHIPSITNAAAPDGSFLASADTTHEFCARTGDGAVSIDVVAP